MLKKILWLSRHNPLPAQVMELQRIFGDVTITVDDKPLSSAEDVIQRMEGYDEVVMVAPLSIISKVVEYGVKPLFADMQRIDRVEDKDRDTEAGGRCYRFNGFKRIVGVKIELEDLR
jgi:hypothetical protein